MDYLSHYDSPLGGMTMESDGKALTALWFDGPEQAGETPEHAGKGLPVFGQTRRWLDIYFSGRDPGFTPELGMRGTAFRKAVWEILRTIPFGETMTYGEVARRLPRASARAVGGAAGHNPIALIVPCHRVIGADGRLTGYAGGLERKARLLEMERQAAAVVPGDRVMV